MISLRTHAISLAAVFLALAIGVALGSGLLSNTLLSGLRDDKNELQNQINTLTDDKNALNEKLNAAGEFDAQMSPRILHDALAGKSVVMFRTPDANDDDVDALSRMVGQAGGTVTGTVALTAGVRGRQLGGEAAVGGELADRARRGAVEHHVGGSGLAGRRPVGNRSADQQGSRRCQPVDDAQRDTVLAALRDTGFVTYGTERIGRANTALIVTGGGLGDDAGNQGATVARFAAGLAPHGSGTVSRAATAPHPAPRRWL